MDTILGKVVYRKHKHMFYMKYSTSVIYIYIYIYIYTHTHTHTHTHQQLHYDLIQIIHKHVVNLLHFLKFC